MALKGAVQGAGTLEIQIHVVCFTTWPIKSFAAPLVDRFIDVSIYVRHPNWSDPARLCCDAAAPFASF